jgi:hypothetical protein
MKNADVYAEDAFDAVEDITTAIIDKAKKFPDNGRKLIKY